MRTKKVETRQFNGSEFKYFIIYDHSSGSRNRYTTLKMLAGCRAQLIGCELPLSDSRRVIQEHEAAWKVMNLTDRRKFYREQGFSASDAKAFWPNNAELAEAYGVDL